MDKVVFDYRVEACADLYLFLHWGVAFNSTSGAGLLWEFSLPLRGFVL